MAEAPRNREELEMSISPRLVAIIESLGLRIHPAHPTPEMQRAGLAANSTDVAKIWLAMAAANPFAPEKNNG